MHLAIQHRFILTQEEHEWVQLLFLRTYLIVGEDIETVTDFQIRNCYLLAQVLILCSLLDIHIVIKAHHLHTAIFLQHTNAHDGLGLRLVTRKPFLGLCTERELGIVFQCLLVIDLNQHTLHVGTVYLTCQAKVQQQLRRCLARIVGAHLSVIRENHRRLVLVLFRHLTLFEISRRIVPYLLTYLLSQLEIVGLFVCPRCHAGEQQH